MTVSVKTLITAKIVESAQTTQYTATGVTALIDKFTATNYSATATTFSVNLVPFGATAGNANLVVKNKTLQAGETYTCPELTGKSLAPGDFISTLAGAATSLNMGANGREIT
jgi:hypothetical protein